MTKRFVKGDYNQNHCELYYGEEHFGDVRTDDADKFIGLLNRLCQENDELKFDKKQLYLGMSRRDKKYREFKDRVFQTLDNNINQYVLEEKCEKLRGHEIRESEAYVKAMALRLLREELIEYV